MQYLAIDFISSDGNHSGLDIANFFFASVKSFGIEKEIQGIILDNALGRNDDQRRY